MCHPLGIKPALLVVPDFHREAPLLRDEGFCAKLRALQEDGHEIYLHGFFHQSRRSYDPSTGRNRFGWLFAQRVVSGGEAEMSDVSADEGRARLAEGERVLQAAGLRVDGFVAPAWSMPPWLLPELAARAYRFTEDHFHIYDPTARQARVSLVLNWATRSPARLLSTVAFCRAARGARTLLPTRIAIHPGDMGFRLVRSEVAAFLEWARGDVVARGAELFT